MRSGRYACWGRHGRRLWIDSYIEVGARAVIQLGG